MWDAIYPRGLTGAAIACARSSGLIAFAVGECSCWSCDWPSPAAADFRLCNNTGSRVGVAVGYKDADGWTTEGWWNLPSRTCETILKGNLVARYYYVYAIDYDHGGEWMGQAFMCTRDKEFTIRGIADCLARGFDRTGFFEVDTGEQRAWTVQLTESSEQAPQRPLSAGNALAPPRRSRPEGRRRPPPGVPPPHRSRPEIKTDEDGSAAPKWWRRSGLRLRAASMIERLFQAGADVFRINMSHTSHEQDARARGDDPQRSRPITTGRSASWSICRDRNCGSAISRMIGPRSTPARILILDTDPAPGDATRVHLPHPEIFAAIKPGDTLLIDDGKLRLIVTETKPERIVARVESRRQDCQPQGRELARHRHSGRRAGGEGPRRSRSGARCRHRLGGAVLHPAAGGRGRGKEDHARARRGDGQDRKAAGRGAASMTSSTLPTD